MEPFQFVFDSQRSLRGAGNLYTSAAIHASVGQVFDRTGHVGTPRPGASKAVGLVEIVGKDLCFGSESIQTQHTRRNGCEYNYYSFHFIHFVFSSAARVRTRTKTAKVIATVYVSRQAPFH